MSAAQGTIKKKLFIRLSSLGDVVLASSALEVQSPDLRGHSVDWVVAHEFSHLLEGHPQIRALWSFDRKSKLMGWIRLCRKLWLENYDEVYDLHSTLRSALMKLFFAHWSFWSGRKMPKWKVISKQRIRLYGYFIFKSLWPTRFRPTSVTARSAMLVGGAGNERPDLRHLLQLPVKTKDAAPSVSGLLESLKGKTYICVMPGSKWLGKRWPVENFAELLSRTSALAVVMGTPADQESHLLLKSLSEMRVPAVSAVGNWNLCEVAQIIAGATRYVGNDTGLGHLAESLGVPASVIFGPTHPDMGFGPWRAESQAIGKDLLCRPCGKDGRYCYRLGDRYGCLKRLKADEVLQQLKKAPMVSEKSIHV